MLSLASFHTFKLHASCVSIETAHDVDSLLSHIRTFVKTNKDFLILGEGSNTVFTEDYLRPVLLNRIMGKELTETPTHHYLRVGAGENWHALVKYCVEQGVGGFENLALIPGTVGAAPIQNIGAYGIEIERFIDKVEFYDTQTDKLDYFVKAQCEFAYRDSVFKRQDANHRIITHVCFKLPKNYSLETSYGPLNVLKNPAAKDIYKRVIEVRQSKLPDPSKLGNAGSFFKNPVVSTSHFHKILAQYPSAPSYIINDDTVKIPAAWLIDTLGFKGKSVGNIACHIEQPLVLVNVGDGKGADLLSLASSIKQQVSQHFAIELENEVRLMNATGMIHL